MEQGEKSQAEVGQGWGDGLYINNKICLGFPVTSCRKPNELFDQPNICIYIYIYNNP